MVDDNHQDVLLVVGPEQAQAQQGCLRERHRLLDRRVDGAIEFRLASLGWQRA